MLLRLLLAVAGGILITATMLIVMSEFSAMFRERAADRLFLIDVLPAPERGRPTRPAAAALPPQREVDRIEEGAAPVGLDDIPEPATAIDTEPAPAPPALEPPPTDTAAH